MFQKATKTKSKARIGLLGPSGAGKTYTALAIAQGLGEKIAVIDSEHGSADKYSDVFSFDTCHLKSFSPQRYIEAIEAANEYDVLVIDSLSHEWIGKDGCIEQVSQISEESNSKNSYTAWGKITPKHNDFVNALLASRAHIIGTLRVKMGYTMESNERGKMQPVKIGLEPVQRDGVEYEFDILGYLNQEHVLTITKTRYSVFDGGIYSKPGKELGLEIINWLNQGADAAPSDQPATKTEIDNLVLYANENGWSSEKLAEYMTSSFGKDFRKNLTTAMVEQAVHAIADASAEKILAEVF